MTPDAHVGLNTVEPQRLAAVRRYEILDSPPEGSFDRVTALAARRFGVPFAAVSIVDEDRVWFKSHHGLSVEQIGTDPGLCATAIRELCPYVLTDALADPRAAGNPLVHGPFGLRFYAGSPLTTSDGFNLGTLCVFDQAPRAADAAAVVDLSDLAAVVMDHMELRLSARRAIAHAELMAREIDHRVMNSLQFVASMLTIQSRQKGSDGASAQLEAAARRVAATALVHRNCFEGGAESGSCLGLIERLCGELAGILDRTITVRGQDTVLGNQDLQAVGLMVNELVTNAAKHGAGAIDVTLERDGAQFVLGVRDHGPGLPPGFDPRRGDGLGMKVLLALAEQLHGKFTAATVHAPPGARFVVTFGQQNAG